LQALFHSAQHIYEKREGSGSGSAPLTNGSGSGSGRPKIIRIPNTAVKSKQGFKRREKKFFQRLIFLPGWPAVRVGALHPGAGGGRGGRLHPRLLHPALLSRYRGAAGCRRHSFCRPARKRTFFPNSILNVCRSLRGGDHGERSSSTLSPLYFYTADHGLINYIDDTKAKCRHLKQFTCKPVLRIRDVYPGIRILIFTHPGFRISDPRSRIPDPKTSTKERGEKILLYFFLM
jgi:hypothetical protein